jgi:sugar porter (SP) family MFS transporter
LSTPSDILFGLAHETGSRSFTILIAATVALGGLLFGYDTSVISGAILFVREQFHLGSVGTEFAVSIVLAGALVGAATGGYLGDRFGRRPVLIFTAILFGVFAVATGMANGLPLFLAARFLIGVAVGVTSLMTPLYIAEIAPARIRGALVTLNQLAIVVGIAAAYCVNYLFAASGNWRAMFTSAVAPAILLLVGLIFLPETPRWLATRGRFDEALAILSRLEGPQQARRSLNELQDVTETDKLALRDLFAPRFRRAMVVGIGLAAFSQITGVNTIIYYTPTILQMGGFQSASSAILGTVLIGAVNVIATIISLLLLDRVGRRPLLLCGIMGMGLSLAHLGFSFGAAEVSRVVILLDLIAYLASFAVGLGCVFWLIASEIYPTTVRAQAMSIATLVVWATDFIVTMTFLTLVEKLGPRYSFWVYAAACAAALLFSLKMVPETKGRTLEEIEKSWAPVAGVK